MAEETGLYEEKSQSMIQKMDFDCQPIVNGNMRVEEMQKDIDTLISKKLLGLKKIPNKICMKSRRNFTKHEAEQNLPIKIPSVT